jgi:hypothetical protein
MTTDVAQQLGDLQQQRGLSLSALLRRLVGHGLAKEADGEPPVS